MDPGLYITQLAGADWRNLANYYMSNPVTTSVTTGRRNTPARMTCLFIAESATPIKINFGFAVNESIKKNDRPINSPRLHAARTRRGRQDCRRQSRALCRALLRLNFGWGRQCGWLHRTSIASRSPDS